MFSIPINSEVEDTGNNSFVRGRMAKGCEYCVKGQKLVLFITGLCGLNCFYCPVSDKKMYKDVIYANEWKIETPEDLLEEARLTDAKGAGITGGDPLVVTDRICNYVKLLKHEFGKKFHIHLYTPLQLVNEERLKKLYDAGLDEIRFHPDIDDKTWWPRISLAQKYSWDYGIEIPCIPGKKKETLELIEFAKGKVKFFNLNELELSERNIHEFEKRNFVTKNSVSYGIKDSSELAMEILKEVKNPPFTLYFCTAKLKDSVQMKNRITKRAHNIKKKFDKITSEGTIIRGAVYFSDLAPGFDYRKKLDDANKNDYAIVLENLRRELVERFKIPEESIFVDYVKLRLIADPKILKKISDKLKELNLLPAVVEEYPTRDAIEIDVRFL
mgnify:CR=1 FL=1